MAGGGGLLAAAFAARLAVSPPHRAALACRWAAPGGSPLTAPDNLAHFCFPMGVEGVRPQAFIVAAEFSFTLTGGDGSRPSLTSARLKSRRHT